MAIELMVASSCGFRLSRPPFLLAATSSSGMSAVRLILMDMVGKCCGVGGCDGNHFVGAQACFCAGEDRVAGQIC